MYLEIYPYSYQNKLKPIFGGASFSQIISDNAQHLNFALRDIDKVFESTLNSVSRSFYDIQESDKEYSFSLDLPGFAKEQVNIGIEDGFLTVTAKNEKRGEVKKSFSLPKNVDVEQIKAALEAGVLTVTLPKNQKHKKIVDIQ